MMGWTTCLICVVSLIPRWEDQQYGPDCDLNSCTSDLTALSVVAAPNPSTKARHGSDNGLKILSSDIWVNTNPPNLPAPLFPKTRPLFGSCLPTSIGNGCIRKIEVMSVTKLELITNIFLRVAKPKQALLPKSKHHETKLTRHKLILRYNWTSWQASKYKKAQLVQYTAHIWWAYSTTIELQYSTPAVNIHD